MKDAIPKHSLREQAISAETAATGLLPLAELWRDLRDGKARVRDAFFGKARCYFVLETNISLERRIPLSSRRRHLLESLLCGEQPKALAARLDVAPSTISTVVNLALQQLGFTSNYAHFHPLLALAARADRQDNATVVGRFADFSHMGQSLRIVGVGRPDDGLAGLLPPAEYAVVRGLVEGKNYLEIARGRGTSTRTVANAIAAAFRRLRVSGRTSLVCLLATEQPACA